MGSDPGTPPVVQAPVVDKDVVQREADDLARKRRGRAAQVLTGDSPPPASAVSVSRLLGA